MAANSPVAFIALDCDKLKMLSIHFSWGVAAMKPGDTLDDMYKAADAELYIKKAGKQG